MEITILITDETDSGLAPEFFDNCAEAVFARLKAGFEECEISLVLTDDETIRKLNHEYRSKDSATDVLSFPLDEDPEDSGGMLGDVVISMDTARAQAFEAAIRIEREVAFLFIHGLLHLLGFDHELGPEEEDEMFDLQEEILQNLLESGKVP
jgi:probable rRNA maturation factor